MTSIDSLPRDEHVALRDDLFMSLELGDKRWKLSIGDVRHRASRYDVPAGDVEAVVTCIETTRSRLKAPHDAAVHSCYEAGRDGWWLHRRLVALGVDSIVVDASSIEVNRRARRAKTDRLDAEKLRTMLVRQHGGEHVWSVLREPTEMDEDARRVHRELHRLMHERTSHMNRIRALLVLHNLRPDVSIAGRDWPAWWQEYGEQVAPKLREEIEREIARLKLVKDQVRAIELERRRELAKGQHPMVAQLARLGAIGPKGAWVLVHEVFGWRRFSNRRELAGCLGLAPTPYASGSSETEQGISKVGNKRVRALLVELAWGWLRRQPDSGLTHWFNRRFANAGARMRRVGIVALARRLAVAMWRFLQNGEIPLGARLKLVTPTS
ncbi:IS110 family RNA-guided transposase [Leptothrix sp. BB-3]